MHSSPVIGADGSVYICASNDLVGGGAPGYLHAFGIAEDNQPPETPTIEGPTEGEVRTYIKYILQANDADKTPISYYIDWGDDTQTQTVDYEPGIPIPVYHKWMRRGTYTIKAKATDSFGLESDWGYLEVRMPMNQQNVQNTFFTSLLEQFPRSFPILRTLLE
jgi:hypothetical protein